MAEEKGGEPPQGEPVATIQAMSSATYVPPAKPAVPAPRPAPRPEEIREPAREAQQEVQAPKARAGSRIDTTA